MRLQHNNSLSENLKIFKLFVPDNLPDTIEKSADIQYLVTLKTKWDKFIAPRIDAIGKAAKVSATVTIDLIADGGAGNQMDEGVHSGNVSGEGTKIVVEVFAKGVTTSLVGVKIEFDFKAEELKLDRVENSAFLFAIPEATGVNLAGTGPVTLPESGFIGRAEFSTVADVTGKEFYIGIKAVTLAETPSSPDVITTTDEIAFNAAPSPDFDG